MQPNRSPIAATTGMLSRNSVERAGQDTRPRSPPGMSPAKKFSPTRDTPASSIARTNWSTSASPGTAVANGHQNSTASNPAALAAAGRSSRGSSVKRIEQLTSYRSECPMIVSSFESISYSGSVVLLYERVSASPWWGQGPDRDISTATRVITTPGPAGCSGASVGPEMVITGRRGWLERRIPAPMRSHLRYGFSPRQRAAHAATLPRRRRGWQGQRCGRARRWCRRRARG